MAEGPNHRQVSDLVGQISSVEKSLSSGADGNARAKLLSLAHQLVASLELPSEAVMRMGFAEPARTAHCKVAVDLKLFEQLSTGGEEGLTAEKLAKDSDADVTLITRLLKHLAAMNIITETEDGKYAATRMSNGFTEPKFRDGISYIYDVPGPSFRTLPKYLKKTSYENPKNLADGPFQYAHATSLPFFGWMAENPDKAEFFNNYMSGYRTGLPNWMDPGFYPVAEKLGSTFDPAISPVMLVDVGGGRGHDLVELKTKQPDLPGELILQDQETVISSIKSSADSPSPFTTTVHDFFTAQPVKHARTYHLHSVLHDWDDDSCVKILSNIAAAMKPGYSSVFIFEMAVPSRSAPWTVTGMDWVVAVLGGMHERTQEEWDSIIHRAGLKVVKVWSVEMGAESLIEAELA